MNIAAVTPAGERPGDDDLVAAALAEPSAFAAIHERHWLAVYRYRGPRARWVPVERFGDLWQRHPALDDRHHGASDPDLSRRPVGAEVGGRHES